MKNTLTILLLLASCLTGVSQSISPEVYSAAGGHYAGNAIQLSWTIGEPVTETVFNNNTIITQGFHQSNYEITSIEKPPGLGYDISVFPNPVHNTLYVNISSISAPSNLHLELINIIGKTLLNKEMEGTATNTQLDLAGYPTGAYFLRIINIQGETIKTFKIIKTK